MTRIHFNNEIINISSSNSDDISTNNINNTIENMLIMCDYNSNLHIASYIYLKKLDNMFIYTMMFLSFISGVIEIINFNVGISNYIYLAVGINNLLLTVVFNRYKELKLSSKANGHYHLYNTFERLTLNIKTNRNIQNSDAFIYKSIERFIHKINHDIDIIFLKRIKFPEKILTKYQINKDENIKLENKNKVMFNKKRKKSTVFDINKSMNLTDLEPINENDKENYQRFLNEIEKNNIEEIKKKNKNLIHFKTNIKI
tara:strand:- start:619 stop:1389 length:771 start_codon:yes stop_codon:yes gene_type:complete